MIKRISIYSLPDGVDPDEFWKYHVEVHARDVARTAGPRLKKYVINRITEVKGGKLQFFGLVETWWDSEEARESFNKDAYNTTTASGKNVANDFTSRVQDFAMAMVEEAEIPLYKG